MERLTTKWNDGSYDTFDPIDIVDNEYSKANYERVLAKLGEYEDLEEQGLLLKLPCKVGNIIWCIENFACDGTLINPPRIREAKFNHHLLEFVGKTVFLTKEEAEETLRKLVEE